MPKYIKTNDMKMAVICTASESPLETAKTLENAGVTFIWNITGSSLEENAPVIIDNAGLNDSLMTLRYFAKNGR